MKCDPLFINLGKIVVFLAILYSVAMVTSKPAFATQKIISGGESIELDAPLTAELQSRFGDGWSRAFYIDKKGARLQLFQDEQLTNYGGVVFEGLGQRKYLPLGVMS
ncbi:hypothetical protein [Burkholderia sp. WAC0059]|uniref:hypothetical protein n=1 Tax=Burkholderia sp. WAC0059 TaxID=2066022 RepID=UPI0011AFC274|nr:hypothetical protein [Burkholderia sp. WAC0059]